MSTDRRPYRFAPWLTGLLLTLGVAGLWGFIWFQALLMWHELAQRESWELLKVNQQGEAVIERNSYGSLPTTYRTLDGRMLESFPGNAVNQIALAQPDAERAPWLEWSSRIWSMRNTTPPTTNWYLIHDGHPQGLAYWVAYEMESKRRAGYLGKDGFSPVMPEPSAQFVVDAHLLSTGTALANFPGGVGGVRAGGFRSNYDPFYLLSDGEVFSIDVGRRTVERVPLADRVLSVATNTELIKVKTEESVYNDYRTRPVFHFKDRILIGGTDPSQENVRTFLIPPELRDAPLELYPSLGTEIVLQRSLAGTHVPLELYWADATGKISRRHDVEIAGNEVSSSRAIDWSLWSAMPAVLAVTVIQLLLLVMPAAGPVNRAALGSVLIDGWPIWLVTFVICLALAAWVYRRQRRLHGSIPWAWALMAFLFGPAGALGYWLHRSWPHQETCLDCGKPTPRDRNACAACARPFPESSRLGIEIFA